MVPVQMEEEFTGEDEQLLGNDETRMLENQFAQHLWAAEFGMPGYLEDDRITLGTGIGLIDLLQNWLD